MKQKSSEVEGQTLLVSSIFGARKEQGSKLQGTWGFSLTAEEIGNVRRVSLIPGQG
jgi:hypothetical protein